MVRSRIAGFATKDAYHLEMASRHFIVGLALATLLAAAGSKSDGANGVPAFPRADAC
jgi:hypothetical protein